jgi:hypothetical protein
MCPLLGLSSNLPTTLKGEVLAFRSGQIDAKYRPGLA